MAASDLPLNEQVTHSPALFLLPLSSLEQETGSVVFQERKLYHRPKLTVVSKYMVPHTRQVNIPRIELLIFRTVAWITENSHTGLKSMYGSSFFFKGIISCFSVATSCGEDNQMTQFKPGQQQQCVTFSLSVVLGLPPRAAQ